MNLYRVKATYTSKENGKTINNVPFEFYAIAEDELQASDKISRAIADTPDTMIHWNLLEDPEQIASNDCGERDALLIEEYYC